LTWIENALVFDSARLCELRVSAFQFRIAELEDAATIAKLVKGKDRDGNWLNPPSPAL
jgi:hypothetical protein